MFSNYNKLEYLAFFSGLGGILCLCGANLYMMSEYRKLENKSNILEQEVNKLIEVKAKNEKDHKSNIKFYLNQYDSTTKEEERKIQEKKKTIVKLEKDYAAKIKKLEQIKSKDKVQWEKYFLGIKRKFIFFNFTDKEWKNNMLLYEKEVLEKIKNDNIDTRLKKKRTFNFYELKSNYIYKKAVDIHKEGFAIDKISQEQIILYKELLFEYIKINNNDLFIKEEGTQLVKSLDLKDKYFNIIELYLKNSKDILKYDQARKWYEDCNKIGILENKIIERLGDIYKEGGFGVEKDIEKAKTCYDKAIKTGNGLAAVKAAYICEAEGGKSYLDAINYYKKAIALDINVCLHLVNIYIKKPNIEDKAYTKAMDYCKQSLQMIKKGNNIFCFKSKFRTYYFNDSLQLKSQQNFVLEKNWDNNYSQGGEELVYRYIGSLYKTGGYGVDKNLAEAEKWYKKAAKIDSEYYRLVGQIQTNNQEAVKYYKKALENNKEASLAWIDIIETYVYESEENLPTSLKEAETYLVYSNNDRIKEDIRGIRRFKALVDYAKILYKEGRYGVTVNTEKEKQWEQKSNEISKLLIK